MNPPTQRPQILHLNNQVNSPCVGAKNVPRGADSTPESLCRRECEAPRASYARQLSIQCSMHTCNARTYSTRTLCKMNSPYIAERQTFNSLVQRPTDMQLSLTEDLLRVQSNYDIFTPILHYETWTAGNKSNHISTPAVRAGAIFRLWCRDILFRYHPRMTHPIEVKQRNLVILIFFTIFKTSRGIQKLKVKKIKGFWYIKKWKIASF